MAALLSGLCGRWMLECSSGLTHLPIWGVIFAKLERAAAGEDCDLSGGVLSDPGMDSARGEK